ncbi:MAG: Ada metal-binding domain-containing protein, partial [Chloroflexota bacterium]
MPAVQDIREDALWRAVAGRDRSYDGTFFFGVRTTGVYCRPGCPSRIPRRDNVVFAFSAELLDRAGYRACKRCRPDVSQPNEADAGTVARLCRRIEEAERTLSLAELARYAGVSASTVSRLFQRALGVTPRM